MNLLIDIGNTRLKWALDGSHGFRIGGSYEAGALNIDSLLAHDWDDVTPENVLISCVGNQQLLDELIQSVTYRWGVVPERLIAPVSGNGIINAYAEPSRLGSDRWAAMVAAYNYVQGAVCVVDCGTAVTLDVVADDGHHLGGLIAPGLRMSQQCLQQWTRIKTGVDTMPTKQAHLGTSTEQCIQQGILSSIAGLIDREYALSRQKLEKIQLVMTGGDTQLLERALLHDAVIVPELVLKGLAIIQSSKQGKALS